MPKNSNLKPVALPMKIRFGEAPTTNFVNNLDAIKVELIDSPSMEQLRSYLPMFLDATWADEPHRASRMMLEQKDDIIREALLGKALPTALETISLTFLIDGISLQEVTHILRHRMASFSADCSGDKWWTHKDALIPNSILNSNGAQDLFTYEGKDDFHTRYATLVMEAKQLYCDMIDSKKISIMDARYILPRCLSTYYFMRISLKDALAFIIQRMDKQIQPETDNIIAYYMYIQILKKIPLCYGLVNIHAPSSFYVKTARTGKATNLYFPDADSDKFDWNPEDFIYQCKRDEMNGTDEGADNYFNTVMLTCEELIDELEREAVVKLKEEYAEDVELWRGSLEYLIPGDDIEEEEWLER